MDTLYGKKFFLKVCTKCGKEFSNEQLFNEHIKMCGCKVVKNVEKAKTVYETVAEKKLQPNIKLHTEKDDGFSELDKVTQIKDKEKDAKCVTESESNVVADIDSNNEIVKQETNQEDITNVEDNENLVEPTKESTIENVVDTIKEEPKQEAPKRKAGRPARNTKKK